MVGIMFKGVNKNKVEISTIKIYGKIALKIYYYEHIDGCNPLHELKMMIIEFRV